VGSKRFKLERWGHGRELGNEALGSKTRPQRRAWTTGVEVKASIKVRKKVWFRQGVRGIKGWQWEKVQKVVGVGELSKNERERDNQEGKKCFKVMREGWRNKGTMRGDGGGNVGRITVVATS